MDFRNRYRIGGTSENITLDIPASQTLDGRIYRYSPNRDAHPRHFVLGNHDPDFIVRDEARVRMKLEPRSKQSICPYSGIVAPDEEFLHPDDRDAALETRKILEGEDQIASEELHALTGRTAAVRPSIFARTGAYR